MQVTLIRHSRTAGNAQYRYIGRTDEALSEDGVRLAQQAGTAADAEKVYVSPLIRTGQTAAVLFPNAVQIVADDLREMDFGDFEGRNFSEMETDAAYRAWVDGGCLAPCPNGESREEFSQRVCAAFENILADAVRHGEESLVFVIHGGTIMAIMEKFALSKRDYYAWSVGNCRGYRCEAKTEPLALTVLGTWGGD